jgi:hypothetical protein
MRLQRFAARDITTLENRGIYSEQLAWPRNAPGAAVKITWVKVRNYSST